MDVYLEMKGTVFSEALIEKIDSAIKIFWKKVHTSMQNAQNDSKFFAQFMRDTGSSMGTINNEVRHFHLWDGERVAEVVAFGSAINGTLLSITPGTTVKLTSAELGWREGLVQLRIDSRTTRMEIKSKP